MNFNRNQAKVLSTAKELELFDDARKPRLNKLTEAELKRLVKRSRTLRDKLRDVKRGQTRSKQSKAAQRGTAASERSVEKFQLYSEVHDVFVARLAAVLAAKAKEAEKTKKKKLLASNALSRTGASSGSSPVKKKATRPAKATAAPKAAAMPTVDDSKKAALRGKTVKARIVRSGIAPRRSHTIATNKRNQSRKDSK